LVASEAINYNFLLGSSNTEGEIERQLQGDAEFTGGLNRALIILIPLAAIIIMSPLALLQFRRRDHGRGGALPVSSTDAGALNVDAASIRDLAERTGSSNRDIISLRCDLTRLRKKNQPSAPATIVITCYPRASMGADIRGLRDDLQARVKEVVERSTGLDVERVDVARVRYQQDRRDRLMD
jgi:hypothetical protein